MFTIGEKYDQEHVGRFFGEYGKREWEDLEADAPAQVRFHLHRRNLRRYVSSD